MAPVLTAERIEKSYGSGAEKCAVLNGVTLAIEEGEFVSVMGPSGSGKSTLLYVLSGMDGADRGTVSFAGRSLARLREKELADLRRTGMGFVFQQPTFLRDLCIIDNVVLPSYNRRTESKSRLFERARSLLRRTGIADLEKRDIAKVSGGQLQRAGICRALMGNPRIVFADEPTGALNSATAREIMQLFSDINRDGTAIALVTHDAAVAAWSDRVLFMRDGEVVAEAAFKREGSKDIEGRTEAVRERLRDLGM